MTFFDIPQLPLVPLDQIDTDHRPHAVSDATIALGVIRAHVTPDNPFHFFDPDCTRTLAAVCNLAAAGLVRIVILRDGETKKMAATLLTIEQITEYAAAHG